MMRVLGALKDGGRTNETDLTYGQKLIAEAIEHHFGERVKDYDEDFDDTSVHDAWEAFDDLLSGQKLGERAAQGTLADEQSSKTSPAPRPAQPAGEAVADETLSYEDGYADGLSDATGHAVEVTKAVARWLDNHLGVGDWYDQAGEGFSADDVVQALFESVRDPSPQPADMEKAVMAAREAIFQSSGARVSPVAIRAALTAAAPFLRGEAGAEVSDETAHKVWLNYVGSGGHGAQKMKRALTLFLASEAEGQERG